MTDISRYKTGRRSFLTGMAAAPAALSSLAPRHANAGKMKPSYTLSDEPLTKNDYLALKETAKKVYAGNRVTTSAGTFHVPSHGKYSSLFGWDSGWHAITMARIDPAIAAEEIRALLSLQVRETGRVSHDTHFPELEEKANWMSKLGSAMGKSQFDDRGRSAMVDPPSYIIAAQKIFERTRDREWLGYVLPRLEACADYLARERDLFGDGLVSVIHPWETGTDSSPAYDRILGLDFSTPFGALERMLLYPRLLDFNARFDWDTKVAKQKNRFVLEDMTFNSIVMRGLQSIARLNREAGRHERAEKYELRAKNMMDAIDNINWVEDEGCYFSRYDAKEPKLAMRTTCASLLPLLSGLVEKERAERIFSEHVFNPSEFRLDFVFPFNAKGELAKEKVYMEDLLLWRGHCIWINMNWMMNHCLMNYGYEEEARELTRRTVKMILHEGFFEFYDFRNGQGKGQEDFNWPGLALDMVHDTWPEAVA